MANFFGTSGSDDFGNTAENDQFDGGNDFDTVIYNPEIDWETIGDVTPAPPTVGIVVNLAAGTVTDGNGQSDTLVSIERVIGTDFADTFVAGANDTEVRTFVGMDGIDIFDLSAMDSSGFTDLRYDNELGNLGIVVNLLAGTITDTYGNVDQVIFPTETTEVFFQVFGTQNADSFIGSVHNNFFRGEEGADTYDGGDGFDYVVFTNETGTSGIVVDLAAGTAVDTYGNVETIANIEEIRGSNNADQITGTDNDERFVGSAGNDMIDGGGGTRDEMRYDRDASWGATNGVNVNLTTGVALDGFGDTDTLSNIERVRGTNFDDILIGDAADNRLRSYDGNDELRGEAGNDRLEVGSGTDTADGGSGYDRAEFSGSRSDYELTFAGAVVTVTQTTDTSNVATLTNIEIAEFSDQSVDLRNGPNETSSEVYRFYNTETGAHFYTASAEERDLVSNSFSQFQFEGNSFGSNATADNGGTEVYRFYNTERGTHFYTASAEERQIILNTMPEWSEEGIAYYAYAEESDTNTALYRFYNTETGAHFFTSDTNERDFVTNNLEQFHYEGIAYYVDIA